MKSDIDIPGASQPNTPIHRHNRDVDAGLLIHTQQVVRPGGQSTAPMYRSPWSGIVG